MQVELIRTASRLEGMGEEWNALAAQSELDSPFLQWEWCSTWWRHYGDGHDLAVLTLRDRGDLVGLAPLYVERRASGGVLRFLGTGEVHSEYLGFLIRRGREVEATRRLLDHVLGAMGADWHLLRITDLPYTARQFSAVERYLRETETAYEVAEASRSWHIQLAPSWDGFLASLSRNRREKLRRARRDMEKCRLDYHEPATASEVDRAWEDLKRLHQRRWETVGEPGCFSSPRFSAFHREMLERLRNQGMITLSSVRAGARTVAINYCLRHRGRIYFYQGGLDPDWMECRPGHVLRMCELKQAIERGDRVYDLLAGDTEYKQQWATHSTPIVHLSVAADGLVPRMRFGMNQAMHWFKDNVRAHMPDATWKDLRRWRKWLNHRGSTSLPVAGPSLLKEDDELDLSGMAAREGLKAAASAPAARP